MLAKHALYQLSYGPKTFENPSQGNIVAQLKPPARLVGPGRLELPTLRLSGVRSNQAELRAYGSETPQTSIIRRYGCPTPYWARDRTA